MTRIEKSPEQLDAEASAPLSATIALHRGLARDDAYIEKLVSHQPPTTFDYEKAGWDQHEAAIIGMNMSARLYRYVEAPSGGEFPWRAGFRRLRRHCRNHHRPYHMGSDVPWYRGSLCQESVRLTVLGPEKRTAKLDGPLSVHDASQLLRYDHLEPVLREAFAYIEAAMSDFRARAERRAREETGRFTIYDQPPEHHAVDGLHRAECPQCRKKEAA